MKNQIRENAGLKVKKFGLPEKNDVVILTNENESELLKEKVEKILSCIAPISKSDEKFITNFNYESKLHNEEILRITFIQENQYLIEFDFKNTNIQNVVVSKDFKILYDKNNEDAFEDLLYINNITRENFNSLIYDILFFMRREANRLLGEEKSQGLVEDEVFLQVEKIGFADRKEYTRFHLEEKDKERLEKLLSLVIIPNTNLKGFVTSINYKSFIIANREKINISFRQNEENLKFTFILEVVNDYMESRIILQNGRIIYDSNEIDHEKGLETLLQLKNMTMSDFLLLLSHIVDFIRKEYDVILGVKYLDKSFISILENGPIKDTSIRSEKNTIEAKKIYKAERIVSVDSKDFTNELNSLFIKYRDKEFKLENITEYGDKIYIITYSVKDGE